MGSHCLRCGGAGIPLSFAASHGRRDTLLKIILRRQSVNLDGTGRGTLFTLLLGLVGL